MLSWKQLIVAPEQTHHLLDGKPAYTERFEHVMKFHLPGLAPVRDRSGAYHIDVDGVPAYPHRFYQTFGFYEGLAAVYDEKGWFHIDTKGSALYPERFQWCGNFQEEKCTVRTFNATYYHLNSEGKPLYQERYRYAGDFKDGVAVVCLNDGKSRHINTKGRFIHPQSFQQLDLFHKGFARAKDERGWFHIDRNGVALYPHRFADVEPFYNGQAHAASFEGDLVVIDETGNIVHAVYTTQPDVVGQLSGDLVGFWRAESLKLALELKVIDALPNSVDTICEKVEVPKAHLERLLRALWEIGIVRKEGAEWVLTQKGSLLQPSDEAFMASAVQMWSGVQNEWKRLKTLFKQEEIPYHLTFKEQSHDVALYQRTLRGYAFEDFQDVVQWEMWGQFEILMTLGQTGITLLTEILKTHTTLKGILLNRDLPLYYFPPNKQVQSLFQNPLEAWPVRTEALLLPRFLHYFPEKECLILLQHSFQALSWKGRLFIFEMVLDESTPSGGLLDLNMLAESGGGLRTRSQWEKLLKKTGFFISHFITLKPHLHMIEACKQ